MTYYDIKTVNSAKNQLLSCSTWQKPTAVFLNHAKTTCL